MYKKQVHILGFSIGLLSKIEHPSVQAFQVSPKNQARSLASVSTFQHFSR